MFFFFDILDLLIFSLLSFCIGLCGIFTVRKNIIILLICIELMLLSIQFNFVIFSIYLDDFFGQLMSLYVISLAGAEAAIGLAILITFYRLRGIISLSFLNSLKG